MKSPLMVRPLIFSAVFALTLVLFFAGQSAMGQTLTGTLKGTVVDPNGQAVPGATVTARNQATGIENQATVSSEGNFSIPNLTLGRYTLTIETGAGFKKKSMTDLDVRLGDNVLGNVALEIGSPTETVTVVGGTEEIVQREQSQLSTSFETRKVEELPSNVAGGGIDTLALLAPGVINNPGAFTNTNGAGLSVNGNRGRSNNFQIDGSDNNDLTIGGPSFFVHNQDSVQEYQLITNNFSAQYGRNQGAIINQVLKSGTNEFHGSAFEFFRDRKHLDSLNNIEGRSVDPNDPSTSDPLPRVRHVFGGTVGGPIVKNRAFFFGTYEGIRQTEQALARSGSIALLPAELTRLAGAFPTNPALNAVVNFSAFAIPFGSVRPRTDLGAGQTVFVNPALPAGQRFRSTPAAGFQGPFLINGPFDVVNIGGTVFQAAFVERVFPTPFTQNEWSARGDVKATNKDNFYVRYLFQDGDFKNNLGSTNGFTGDVPFRSKNFGGTYTRQVASSVVNEFRAFYQSLFVKFGGGCAITAKGCIEDPTEIESPQAFVESIGFGIAGLNSGSTLRSIGVGVGFPQGRLVKVYQAADNLTFTHGKHSFIAGLEFKHLKNEVPFLPRFNGQFTFSSATRLLNNAPSAITIAAGPPVINYTENDQSYFIQDDWKVRDNLTLNLGLRYEYTGQPINDLNDLTTARESTASTAIFNPALPIAARVVPRIPADRNNFAPRIGFAWTPRFGKSGFMHSLLGDDATVIRGGFSIAYDPAFYNILLNVSNSAPVSATLTLSGSTLPSSNSPLPLPSVFGADIRRAAAASGLLPIGKLDPRLLTQSIVAPDFHSPYSEQFSLGIQRQINKNNVAEVRYVGTHGVGLFQTVDRNPLIFNLYNGFQTIVSDVNGNDLTVNFPAFRQFIPSGVVPAACTNIASTPDNEGICDGRLVPGRGRISARENTATSNYHSMQARYNGRFLNNSLTAGAAYTWSKTIDNASEIFADSENTVIAQNPFNIGRAERSLSNLDRPHAFAANFIYDVPFYKEQHGFVGHVLGGWQLNATQILTSGRPYTPSQSFNSLFLVPLTGFDTSRAVNPNGLSYQTTTGTDPLRPFTTNPGVSPRVVGISQVDAALIYGAPVANVNGFYSLNDLNNGIVRTVAASDVHFVFNGPGAARIFGTPFGNTPRNALRGPAINALNLGIFKNTKVRENLRVRFRAELFNALNHPSPGYGDGSLAGDSIPDINVEDAGFTFADKGEMTLNRRVVQFGLRIIF